jgi:hypothetical protein
VIVWSINQAPAVSDGGRFRFDRVLGESQRLVVSCYSPAFAENGVARNRPARECRANRVLLDKRRDRNCPAYFLINKSASRKMKP